jgi:hypothetical protein
MGTTAFVVVWVPLCLTFLVAGLVSLRHARALRRSGDSVSFERRSSPIAADRALSSLPFLDGTDDADAREYRLVGAAMLAGSAVSLAVGAVQLL